MGRVTWPGVVVQHEMEPEFALVDAAPVNPLDPKR